MPGRVELVLGDVFNGPSDMIIIPCSTIPTVSDSVAEKLRRFRIDFPTRPMNLGDVAILPMIGGEQIAQTVGYAATVLAGRGSSEHAIERIGAGIAEYSDGHRWVRIVACPLLGTGAGGIGHAASAVAVSRGFLSTAPEDAILRLFALESNGYDAARASLQSPAPRDVGLRRLTRPPRVFLSYTQSSDAHALWVKEIAGLLRSNGVDARLDVWHLRPGMDLPQWMCNELDLADRVLVFCDRAYAGKADRRHGGVGWEVRVIQGELLQSQKSNPDKFIPIICDDSISESTPAFLKSVFGIHWPPSQWGDRAKLDEVLRAVFRAAEEPPPIGNRPSFVVG